MAGVMIYNFGRLYQGYSKDDKQEYYCRYIEDNGESYTGEFKQDKRNGKGEYEWADGSRQIAYYVNGWKKGAAKYYDKNGIEQDRFYRNDKLVNDSGNFINSDISDDLLRIFRRLVK